jgi:hypothetical protein
MLRQTSARLNQHVRGLVEVSLLKGMMAGVALIAACWH